MTSTGDGDPLRVKVIDLEPRHLRTGEGATSEAARAFSAETDSLMINEPAAWQRMTVRLLEPTAKRQVWRWVVAPAVGVAIAGLLVLRPRTSPEKAHTREPVDQVKTAVASSAVVASEAAKRRSTEVGAGVGANAGVVPSFATASNEFGARVRLSAVPRRLPAGAVDLVGEARVTLGGGARAIASTNAGSTQIALARGWIELHVQPRLPGRTLQVAVGGHRFVVIGTSFRVARRGRRLMLTVHEGRVGVWRGQQPETVVAAGERWTGRSSSSTKSRLPARVARATPAVAATEEIIAPCETAAGQGRLLAAVDCYRRIADGGDLAADLALYEVARLEARRAPNVEDAAADALETLAEHRRRFPESPLRLEVDLTQVELLPRVGEHRRALKESDRILRAHPDHERRRELRLLRGNIYREALGDCMRAEVEYREAGAEGGREQTADDAAFYRAICLELRGTSVEATAALRAYLDRPAPRHAAEARKRLSAHRREGSRN